MRCLLIDVSTPWTSELNNNVSTALSHLFALVTNTAGINRIPSISIFVIGKQVEVSKTVYNPSHQGGGGGVPFSARKIIFCHTLFCKPLSFSWPWDSNMIFQSSWNQNRFV